MAHRLSRRVHSKGGLLQLMSVAYCVLNYRRKRNESIQNTSTQSSTCVDTNGRETMPRQGGSLLFQNKN
jgi:hypothetical protein